MYSVSQAALKLGVCINTIHRWDKASNLLCFRTVGGHRRIPLSEINRLLSLMHRELINDPS
ncbi:MAG: MerR family transcriptional regulator [Candidatus Thorarchaeota archaeon]